MYLLSRACCSSVEGEVGGAPGMLEGGVFPHSPDSVQSSSMINDIAEVLDIAVVGGSQTRSVSVVPR